jgi:hypothetical protein
MTMMTTKTFVLAAFATFSLAGAVMAQDGGVGPAQDYQAAKILAARQAQLGLVQSGSSDVSSARGGIWIGSFHMLSGGVHTNPVPVGVPGGGNG